MALPRLKNISDLKISFSPFVNCWHLVKTNPILILPPFLTYLLLQLSSFLIEAIERFFNLLIIRSLTPGYSPPLFFDKGDDLILSTVTGKFLMFFIPILRLLASSAIEAFMVAIFLFWIQESVSGRKIHFQSWKLGLKRFMVPLFLVFLFWYLWPIAIGRTINWILIKSVSDNTNIEPWLNLNTWLTVYIFPYIDKFLGLLLGFWVASVTRHGNKIISALNFAFCAVRRNARLFIVVAILLIGLDWTFRLIEINLANLIVYRGRYLLNPLVTAGISDEIAATVPWITRALRFTLEFFLVYALPCYIVLQEERRRV